MALVLTMKKGQDFYVGSERFVVTHLHKPNSFSILHKCSKTGEEKSYRIVEERLVEILPGVFASAGEKVDALLARVTIEAPREVLIVRGDKWRNPPADKVA